MKSADELEQGKQHLAGGRPHEADAAFERALSAEEPQRLAQAASAAGRLAHRAGQALLAARWYARAAALDPRDPEHPHDRGLALLEAGEVGLAAQAQAAALALDPDHLGARAQRAAALEALGDDEGAARELEQVLRRTGPQPALHARLLGLREAAARASHRSLIGVPLPRLRNSRLVGAIFAPESSTDAGGRYRSGFGTLRAAPGADGRVRELVLLFDDMEASLHRTDLAYGGATEDDQGRRVPLDEFSSAATIFLSEALGVEPQRVRRILRWLLSQEAGRGPHRLARAHVSWLILAEGGSESGKRRYGLSVEAAPELV